ncbi:MAG: nucleoside deaminase, partial [Gemmatimonadetes bacterium]|nr:nucleoside deaminase [Gemmatimonadota bacterium]
MEAAVALAEEAGRAGEVPVGAVIVRAGRVIGRGRNRMRERADPTAHAEMEAISAARAETGSARLDGDTLYVTLEPCPMCAGAI